MCNGNLPIYIAPEIGEEIYRLNAPSSNNVSILINNAKLLKCADAMDIIKHMSVEKKNYISSYWNALIGNNPERNKWAYLVKMLCNMIKKIDNVQNFV